MTATLMKQNRLSATEKSEKVHRRFASLTSDDVAALEALDPAAARAFENLLLQQYRDEQEHRQHCPVRLDEHSADAHRSRWSHGAGGGRRRPRAEPQP